MEGSNALRFESPSFWKRLKGMLGVDFYRLFHTPMFYIFLVIAALIPAIIMGTMGMEGEGEAASLYSNGWQIVAAYTPLYVVSDIGEYANMNMVFIFGGIMISIFIGHDYKSGYVKQLFTTHAKKQDYVLSKSIVGAFSMSCMCLTYLLGGVGGGLFSGISFNPLDFAENMTAGVMGIVCAIVGKMLMSLGWSCLYTLLNVIFRKLFGISILSCFFFGTGILIVGAAALIGNNVLLNVFLYGSSVYACLGSNPLTLLVCLVCSLTWSAAYIVLGTRILSKNDVY